jgi:2-iminobutanoate/2-iminopropanoate deaminase
MKEIVQAGSAPMEMPFVPAISVRGGRTVYLSGTGPVPIYHKHPHDPAELRPPEDIGEQTRITLDNLRLVLEKAGGKLTDVVKVVIYNTDVEHQDDVNRVYTEFFGEHRPARSHVGVNKLVHEGMKIEIEAIAVIDEPDTGSGR